jgi:CBS domain-containing protein
MEVSDPIASVLSNKSSKLWTISPEATVFNAIEKMSECNVGALPVIDDGALIGIISERDYTRNVILKGKSSHDIDVRSIMTSTLVTIKESDSVAHSLQTMTQKRVRHLPVVANGELVGIVTIGDLVKWTISAQDGCTHRPARRLHSRCLPWLEPRNDPT